MSRRSARNTRAGDVQEFQLAHAVATADITRAAQVRDSIHTNMRRVGRKHDAPRAVQAHLSPTPAPRLPGLLCARPA